MLWLILYINNEIANKYDIKSSQMIPKVYLVLKTTSAVSLRGRGTYRSRHPRFCYSGSPLKDMVKLAVL